MATSPQLPGGPGRPQLVQRDQAKVRKPVPWMLVAAIITILVAVGLAWYFFH